jgi:hypothetical protein
MPVTPYTGMVDSAIRFKSLPSLWLCIGRSTPWTDENAPPDENDFDNFPEYLSMTMPEEPIALKRIDFAGLCVPDIDGDIKYQNQRYKYVPDVDAVSLLARWVYVRASLDYYERNSAGAIVIGQTTYRQACLISGLVPLPPYKEENVLAPNQVASWGRLVCVVNMPPRDRDPKMRDVIQFLREFRG